MYRRENVLAQPKLCPSAYVCCCCTAVLTTGKGTQMRVIELQRFHTPHNLSIPLFLCYDFGFFESFSSIYRQFPNNFALCTYRYRDY